MNIRCCQLLLLLAISSMSAGQQARQIDPQKSMMTVRVYKSGLFSALAHDHEISAPITSGTFDESTPSVNLSLDSRKLRVMDKEASEKDRAEIQQTMLGPKVLDSENFPEIRFQSTHIERRAENKWLVSGDLTLHGQTRPVRVEVEGNQGRYRGSSSLMQKDFGIEPVRIAGGTVRVKNEVRVEFEIVGR